MNNKTKERFEAKINKTNDCWLWTGAKNDMGYGYIRLDGRSVRAHRVSYELYVGKISKTKQINHKCHVRNCVKPTHLYAGTSSQNMIDMFESGRGETRRGEKSAMAKLTTANVRAIRKSVEKGISTQKDLAKQYGVSNTVISNVVNRKSWKHIL